MTIFEIIKALESTTSRNQKIAILKEAKNSELGQMLAEVLQLTYDPFTDYYVIKLPEMDIGNKTFEEMFDEFKRVLAKLKDRKTTGNDAINLITNVISQMNEQGQYIAKQILERKFRKAAISAKTINKVFNNLIPEFKIQLAKQFTVNKLSRYPDKFVATPKLDGIRAIFWKNSGLFFRNGKPITNLRHITGELNQICDKYNIKFVDGELWTKEFTFNTIQSAVMSNKYIKKDLAERIKFNVFAMDFDGNSEDMMIRLSELFENSKTIKTLPFTVVNSDIETIAYYTAHMIKLGYEGLMLRDYYVNYSWKRDYHLLKVKAFQLDEMREYIQNDQIRNLINEVTKDMIIDDFTIVDLEEGTGNYEGMLGAFVIEGEVNGTKIRSNAGIGLTMEERQRYWKMRNDLVGKEVVVKFQGVTPDGSLRFPIVKAVKLDR